MRILFVCIGNICRSPMAEGILRSMAADKKVEWQIESAGLEHYHVGSPPDLRAIRTCKRYGIDISMQRARRISKNDFSDFDVIYALAKDVLDELNGMKPHSTSNSTVKLLLEEVYPGQNRSVPDPWYGNESGFETVFKMLETVCKAIIEKYS